MRGLLKAHVNSRGVLLPRWIDSTSNQRQLSTTQDGIGVKVGHVWPRGARGELMLLARLRGAKSLSRHTALMHMRTGGAGDT